MGMPEDNVLIAQSGDVVSVKEHDLSITGEVHVGHVLVDRSDSETMDTEAIHDRRILAQEGVVSPIVAIRLNKRPKVVNFHFLTKAVSGEDSNVNLHEDIEDIVVKIVENCTVQECRDEELMKAKIGKAIRRYMLKAMRIRPMILPVIFEVE
jgi:ribonuclease J